MKVVIFAGGYGTRLSEETDVMPKPMAQIGDKPILWHIMKCYSYYGFNDFIILLGYKGYIIKEYFANYFMHQSDLTIDLSKNTTEIINNHSEPWRITLLDTGQNSMTGGRLLRARKHLENTTFMATYGDGVSNINLQNLLQFHHNSGGIATLSAVYPEGRFGAVNINAQHKITGFQEKPQGDGQMINGGFFVFNPKIFSYLRDGEATILERAPLELLASEGELNAFEHREFWKCMDTLRDKNQLNELWEKGAPWKIWHE